MERGEDNGLTTLVKKVQKRTNESISNAYKPSRSGSWGVYERPADISKAYGGGRRITREEMRRMDEEYESKLSEDKNRYRTDRKLSQDFENGDEDKIRDAVSSCRSFMMYGDRKRAVKVLEDILYVEPFSFKTELGGEAYLEYGMVLETVDREEEARSIYGQLATVSSSPKIRRNAFQLLQGLELTMKLRRKGPILNKPVLDMESLQAMSSMLSVGLTNEWDQYKKKNIAYTVSLEGKKDEDLYKLETIFDTYNLLLKVISSSLKAEKIPPDVINRALRKMYFLGDGDKMELVKWQFPVPSNSFKSENKQRTIEDEVTNSVEIDNESRCKDSLDRNIDDISITPASTKTFEKYLNGSWELVLSISDSKPKRMKRVSMGEVRRIIDFTPIKDCQNISSGTVLETAPSMWGLSTLNVNANFNWNPSRNEMIFEYESSSGSRKSPAPWCLRSKYFQTLQTVWVDENMMITVEMCQRISSSNLFTVWKRMRPIVWNKF